jgi:hypothetical protein
MKSNHKNVVHLVGLHTYCKMMHGAYSVKLFAISCINLVSRGIILKEMHLINREQLYKE